MKLFAALFAVAALLSGGLACPHDEVAAADDAVPRAPVIVSRAGWGARPPTSTTTMSTPVTHVVIHHTYSPGACTTQASCESTVRGVQNSHMNSNGWSDIGYSFLVGGDNRAYEGRGWARVGAHAPGYNDRSIGICVIGDWTTSVPPSFMLQIVRDLISTGVDQGYIASDYALLGHRQTRPTECPGTPLYEEISTWPHWSAFPPPLFPFEETTSNSTTKQDYLNQ